MKSIRTILAIDSIGALITGILILGLSSFIAPLYAWSHEHVLFVAAGHLSYGTYSGILALGYFRKSWLPSIPVTVLIIANAVWAGQCFTNLWLLRHESSWLGLSHLAMEGVYLFVLAYLEARIFIPELNPSSASE